MTFEEIVLADQQELQNETCCVIEEQQDWNGFAIMTYKEIKRTATRNPVLYTGSYDECKSFISRSIAAQELIDSANREHVPNWQYDTTKTVQENHKDFSEFCNSNSICLEDFVRYIYEEKGVATQDVMTANEIERSLYSQCLEECEFKPKQSQRETYTREEVYLVAQRSVYKIINNLLTDNRTRTMDQVINSEIDTVKLF